MYRFDKWIIWEKRANWVVYGAGTELLGPLFIWLAGFLDPPEEILRGLPLYKIENNDVLIHSPICFLSNKISLGANICLHDCISKCTVCWCSYFSLFKEKNWWKKLWLRNNVSTVISQLIDSSTVI